MKASAILAATALASVVLASSCATPPRPNPLMRPGDLKFIGHDLRIETDAQGNTTDRTIVTLRVQNAGTERIRGARFRLSLRDQRNGQLVYSRTHTLELSVGPRDTQTKELFLQEFVYNVPYAYVIDDVELW
jgi:hypothetical protein